MLGIYQTNGLPVKTIGKTYLPVKVGKMYNTKVKEGCFLNAVSALSTSKMLVITYYLRWSRQVYGSILLYVSSVHHLRLCASVYWSLFPEKADFPEKLTSREILLNRNFDFTENLNSSKFNFFRKVSSRKIDFPV